MPQTKSKNMKQNKHKCSTIQMINKQANTTKNKHKQKQIIIQNNKIQLNNTQ